MIVFYNNNIKRTQVVTLKPALNGCNTSCATNCIKVKSKCCNKYKKKGVNCKRCPLTIAVKAVS